MCERPLDPEDWEDLIAPEEPKEMTDEDRQQHIDWYDLKEIEEEQSEATLKGVLKDIAKFKWLD